MAMTPPVKETTSLRGFGWGRSWWAWIRRAYRLSLQRRSLYRLDDAALHDLGLSRADAWHEAERPFWDQSGGEVQDRSC